MSEKLHLAPDSSADLILQLCYAVNESYKWEQNSGANKPLLHSGLLPDNVLQLLGAPYDNRKLQQGSGLQKACAKLRGMSDKPQGVGLSHTGSRTSHTCRQILVLICCFPGGVPWGPPGPPEVHLSTTLVPHELRYPILGNYLFFCAMRASAR